jgi:hypothetical protein
MPGLGTLAILPLLLFLAAPVGSAAEPTPATVAGLPAPIAAGRGAAAPFVEYEAENADGNGELVGPDRSFSTLASEASGRKAVRLVGRGRFVEFTLRESANALTVRYALPDSPGGGGIDATLGVYVEGERIASLDTSSRYGWYYGRYPFTNDPAAGGAHHFFDEARTLLGRNLPAGTRVRLMVGDGDLAPWYAIDLVDFELVPPPQEPPAAAISILHFGADPAGSRESSGALRSAIRDSRRLGRPVWIPPGRFRLEKHVIVDRVTIAGAGPWYSVLRGRGAGLYGRKAPHGSRQVILRDFAIIGEVRERDDRAALAGIGGAIGGGSRIENLWIQHHKTGVWIDGPAVGVTFSGLRILDNSADGLNLRGGVGRAVVENSFVRNSGDDGLALWSHRLANHDIVLRHNTVVAPSLANGIAVYGGRDISVIGNVVADTLTQGGGIHLGNRFDAVPLAGHIRLTGNLILRSGSLDPNWRFGIGALWFYALDAPIAARIEIRDTEILDSTLPAIQFIGKRVSGVTIEAATIRGASHALQIQAPGSASFSRVEASDLSAGGVLECRRDFRLVLGPGNIGWQSPATASCGPLPLSGATASPPQSGSPGRPQPQGAR